MLLKSWAGEEMMCALYLLNHLYLKGGQNPVWMCNNADVTQFLAMHACRGYILMVTVKSHHTEMNVEKKYYFSFLFVTSTSILSKIEALKCIESKYHIAWENGITFTYS